MEYQLGECKSCDALADQIAELTKTNLEQAAQIEMLTTAAINVVGPFIHAEQGSPIQILSKAISTTPPQALEAFAAKVRNEAYEKAAVFCDLQQDEPECPERASYCAEAIRNLKELP